MEQPTDVSLQPHQQRSVPSMHASLSEKQWRSSAWLEKAVSSADLTRHEKTQLYKASTHWLRHTFGTRLIEKGAAPDAVQSSMGHASPVTLSRYTRSSAKRQFSEVAKVFGE